MTLDFSMQSPKKYSKFDLFRKSIDCTEKSLLSVFPTKMQAETVPAMFYKMSQKLQIYNSTADFYISMYLHKT